MRSADDEAGLVNRASALEGLYGQVSERSRQKVQARLTPLQQAWLRNSRFVVIASIGPTGIDCSPRGDTAGQLVHVPDERTLLLADRRGNNRVDTLRNLIDDPRIGLLFLVRGDEQALRVRGRAEIRTDAALLERFRLDGGLPTTVLRVTIQQVLMQNARAVRQSGLWRA